MLARTYLAHKSPVHVRNEEYRHALVRYDQQNAVHESDTVQDRYVTLRSLQREQLPRVALEGERQEEFVRRDLVMLVERGRNRQRDDGDKQEAARKQEAEVTLQLWQRLLISVLALGGGFRLKFRDEETKGTQSKDWKLQNYNRG